MAKFRIGKLLGRGSIVPRIPKIKTGITSSTLTGFNRSDIVPDFSMGHYRPKRRRGGRRRRRS